MATDAPLEDQLLGGLLHCATQADGRAYKLINNLSDTVFRIPSNRLIYVALRELLATSASADLVSVSTRLASRNELWTAGGGLRLAYLWSCACLPEELPVLAQLFG